MTLLVDKLLIRNGLSMEDEYRENMNKIAEKALTHTDLIVVGAKENSKFELRGLGSSIFIRYKEANYLLTCSHVIGNNTIFFSGAKKLHQNERLNNDPTNRQKNLTLLEREDSIDTAILSGYPEGDTAKTAYDIEKSRFLNKEIAEKNIGTLCCFVGVMGEHTQFGPWPDILYANVCYVKAMSGLGEIQNGCLTGDFAAKEIADKQEGLFPSLTKLKEGGEINLCGCSGCGLWGIDKENIFLLGMLQGKNPGDPAKEHIIRFTPVWDIIALLDSKIK